MQCVHCDHTVPESAKTCPECGRVPDLPPGVKGWSWGALLLNWIWSLFNGPVWLGLLALVPYVGFVMAIVLGFKGREWAWRARRWESVAHFQRVQRNWSRWAVGIFGGVFLLAPVLAIVIPAYQQYQHAAALHARGQR